MRTKIVVGLAAAATLLAGCGGTGSSADPSASALASASSSSSPSEAAPSSAAPSSAVPSSAAPSGTAAAANVVDPCSVIPASKTKALIGYTFSSAKAGTVAGSKLCSYVPASADDPSLIAQAIALTGDFDRFATAAEAQLPGATSSDITISGADRAKLLNVDLSGSPTVAVLASADGVFYQVIIGGPKLAADDGQKAATTYATALIKG